MHGQRTAWHVRILAAHMPARLNPAKRRIAARPGLLLLAAIALVIAVAGCGGGTDDNTSSANSAKPSPVALAGIPQSGVTLGRPDAPALIREFVDPQCPYCRQFELSEMPTVVRKAVRTGRARFDLRVLTALGPDSVKAGRVFSAAALQNKLFDVSSAFYANQGQENSGYVTDRWLQTTLGPIKGFDLDRALSEAADPRSTEQLGAARTLASRYGVRGTPTLLVGTSNDDLENVEPTADAILAAVEKVAP